MDVKKDIMAGVPAPPIKDNEIKELKASLRVRGNGKALCTRLKNARKALAEANGIPYETEHCPNEGSCAGTCEKCDAEIEYLNQEMEKIPEEKRVYPKLNINPFRTSEECKSSPNHVLEADNHIVGCLRAENEYG